MELLLDSPAITARLTPSEMVQHLHISIENLDALTSL
jgi:hypothetical protein